MAIRRVCVWLWGQQRVSPQVFSKSYGERWFLAIRCFLEHKSLGRLLSAVFQEHGAHVQFNIVAGEKEQDLIFMANPSVLLNYTPKET